MAKTIKFNLVCDDKPVRTVEDLQNNFAIEDVLEYYNNGLLLRWLGVRGYAEELAQVEAIKAAEPMAIVKELVKIFDIAKSDKELEEGVYMMKYQKDRDALCAAYAKANYETKSIIADYQQGYKKLVSDILSNPQSMGRIKANIAEIAANYRWIFELNHRELFWLLKKHSPLAVMCLLMNEACRYYYLPKLVNDGAGQEHWDINTDLDKKKMYDAICNMIKEEDFLDAVRDNIKQFTGNTNGYWKELEYSGKKYMIIKTGKDTLIHSYHNKDEEYDYNAANNRFIITDGLEYNSNSDTNNTLIYMEV